MINNESRSDRFGTTSTLPATPDIIEEKVKDARERGIEFVYQKPVVLTSTISAEDWLKEALTTVYQRGRGGVRGKRLKTGQMKRESTYKMEDTPVGY